MVDPKCEHLCRLTAVPSALPSRPHLATVWRWGLHGVRGVKLETLLIGGVRYTSDEAVARFISRLNEPGAVREPVNAAAERAGEAPAAMGA